MSTNKISKVQLNNEQYSLKGDASNIKDVMLPTVDDIYSKITTGTDNTTILLILENISGLLNSKADRSELDSIWNQINALNARIPRSSINYYFAYKASTHIPQRPGNDLDYVPDGWTGYPITPNANEVLYMTMARKSNDEWLNWEGNYRWTQPIAYSDKSSQTLNIEGSIALYKLSQGTPTLSPDERRTKAYPSGWSTTPDFVSLDNKEIYMITAKTLNGDLVLVNNYYWSAPMRIGDGTTSGTGADGLGYNYIYALKPSSSNLSAPSFTVQQIEESSTHSITENGTTWYDRPLGVSEINKYEYISVSVGSDDNGWSAWSTPVVWSKWGEKGMDGDAVEYIYKRTEAEQVLTLNLPYSGRVGNQAYSNIYANNEVYSKNDDFIPNGWEDNPSGVDENNPCEYVAIRKKKDEVWQPFELPVLWAKYGKQGLPGVVNGYILYGNNDSVIIDDDFFINNNNDSASFNRLAGATYKLEKTSGESISPTYSIDADKSLPTGITATIDSNGVLTYNVTATNSKIPLGTYYVIINGKVDGNVVASRKQTLYVTDFNNGASYQLIVTPPTIKTNTNGKFREAVTISVLVNEIHESVTTLSSLPSGMYYDVEENGDSSHKVASNVTSLTRQIANAGDTAPDYYVVNLYLNGVLVDSEAIDIYKDGELGIPGNSGTSPYLLELDNDNVVVDDDITGANLMSISTCNCNLYSGRTKLLIWTMEVSLDEPSDFIEVYRIPGNYAFYLRFKSGQTFDGQEDLIYKVTVNAKIGSTIVATRKQTVYVKDINESGDSYSFVISPNSFAFTRGSDNSPVSQNTVAKVKVLKHSSTGINHPIIPYYSSSNLATNNGIYILYPANITASSTSELGYSCNLSTNVYNVNGYTVELHEKTDTGDILWDSETVDCIIPGSNGLGRAGNVFKANPEFLIFDTSLNSFSTGLEFTAYEFDENNNNSYSGLSVKLMGPNLVSLVNSSFKASYTAQQLNENFASSSVITAVLLKNNTLELSRLSIAVVKPLLGIQGAVLRYRGIWKEIVGQGEDTRITIATKFVCNDPDNTEDLIKFIDVVQHNNKYYLCNLTHNVHIGAVVPSLIPGGEAAGNPWIEANQFDFLVTKTLIADYLSAHTVSSDDVVITKRNSSNEVTDIVAGMTSSHSNLNLGDVRIWAGTSSLSPNILEAAFKVTLEGKMIANDANIIGVVNANSFRVFDASTPIFEISRVRTLKLDYPNTSELNLFTSDQDNLPIIVITDPVKNKKYFINLLELNKQLYTNDYIEILGYNLAENDMASLIVNPNGTLLNTDTFYRCVNENNSHYGSTYEQNNDSGDPVFILEHEQQLNNVIEYSNYSPSESGTIPMIHRFKVKYPKITYYVLIGRRMYKDTSDHRIKFDDYSVRFYSMYPSVKADGKYWSEDEQYSTYSNHVGYIMSQNPDPLWMDYSALPIIMSPSPVTPISIKDLKELMVLYLEYSSQLELLE